MSSGCQTAKIQNVDTVPKATVPKKYHSNKPCLQSIGKTINCPVHDQYKCDGVYANTGTLNEGYMYDYTVTKLIIKLRATMTMAT